MIRIRGLNARYGESHVLRGIDLELAPAEVLGLLGRNGMGKTTLIRSLMGYVKPTAGTISVDGHDVTGWPTERIARLGIGYVPEGRGIFGTLSVRENLLVAARAASDGRRDWGLERVLATFPRLSARLGQAGATLSGGEQQMLSIGRALMTNPRLLILDEATEGLAPLIVAEIWGVIDAIAATGIAALIVDRDYRKVVARATHAMVLQKGQVVLAGRARDVAADARLAALLGL